MAIDVDFRTFSASKFHARGPAYEIARRSYFNITYCNEDSVEVLGLQSGVGGEQSIETIFYRCTDGYRTL